jgi:peptidoglycan hydrolase-like protein with peptidoglycan-binding domain
MRPEESFVSQSVRSLQTMLRVLAEDDPMLLTVAPDGIYGQETMNAVSTFQRRYGIPVTGVTDQATWERIAGEYRPALVRIGKAEPIEIIFDPGQVFRLGDSSPYLYLLQSMLLVLSKDHPTISQPPHTGVLDADTSAALAGFQVLAGLEPTGELDRETWKFLSRQFTLNANHQVVRS